MFLISPFSGHCRKYFTPVHTFISCVSQSLFLVVTLLWLRSHISFLWRRGMQYRSFLNLEPRHQKKVTEEDGSKHDISVFGSGEFLLKNLTSTDYQGILRGSFYPPFLPGYIEMVPYIRQSLFPDTSFLIHSSLKVSYSKPLSESLKELQINTIKNSKTYGGCINAVILKGGFRWPLQTRRQQLRKALDNLNGPYCLKAV